MKLMTNQKLIIQQVIWMLLIAAFVVCAGFYLYIQKPSNTAQSSDFELISSKVVYNPTLSEIKGRIKNNAKKEFQYTDVIINLYDAKGDKIGEVQDNSGDLEPGATWYFDAIGAPAKIATYKIAQITGT